MDSRFISEHLVMSSIVIFLFFYTVIVILKPHFLYNRDGSLRQFGVGYKNKTVIPAWLLAIVLGILCYYLMLYISAFPKLLL